MLMLDSLKTHPLLSQQWRKSNTFSRSSTLFCSKIHSKQLTNMLSGMKLNRRFLEEKKYNSLWLVVSPKSWYSSCKLLLKCFWFYTLHLHAVLWDHKAEFHLQMFTRISEVCKSNCPNPLFNKCIAETI